MIQLSGSAHRVFTFPADLPTAFAYYADLAHTLRLLPHISIQHQYDDASFRMLYATHELGVYQVRLFCDIQAVCDERSTTLRFQPCEQAPRAPSTVGLYSLCAPGDYHSTSRFYERGQETEIEYSLRLRAELPLPIGARLMPQLILDNLANSITNRRIDEIAGAFITRSIRQFRLR